MRMWSFHPRYLDAKGLVALWRESLLAQAVLTGRTRGYRSHPQLERFRACDDPLGAIALYLGVLRDEALRRGYTFDAGLIGQGEGSAIQRVAVPRGQVEYEWALFRRKARLRDAATYEMVSHIASPDLHPLFSLVPGGIASWERPKDLGADR